MQTCGYADNSAALLVVDGHLQGGSAVKLCVVDCVTGRIRPGVPQATEWQRIGNQIDAAMIFARADFVSVQKPLQRMSSLITG